MSEYDKKTYDELFSFLLIILGTSIGIIYGEELVGAFVGWNLILVGFIFWVISKKEQGFK